MDANELKALLYRSYALGYESGVARGNINHLDVCWGRQKYSFEYDIDRLCQNTGKEE